MKKRKKVISRQSKRMPSPPQKPTTSTAMALGRERKHILIFSWTMWKNFWALAGPLVSLVGLWFLLHPSIDVTVGGNLDPSQQFQSLLIINNRGHVPVYNLQFSCGIKGPTVVVKELSFTASNLAPVAELPTGRSVTRNCFSKSEIPESGMLEFVVTYDWPITGYKSQYTSLFSVKSTTSGSLLTLPPHLNPY